MITKGIELRVQNKGLLNRVHAVQGDSGRTLRCIISDSDLPLDSIARFYARKPSGKQIYNDSLVIDANSILVDLTEQTLAEAGTVECQIEILNSDETEWVTSFRFDIIVEKSELSGMSLDSFDEGRALKKYVDAVKEAVDRAEEAASEIKANASLSESWAVGGTNSREGEDTDNSKYYSEQSAESAKEAAGSSREAASSQKIAEESIKKSAGSAILAESWTVGGTKTREGEDADNSKYYCEQAKAQFENARIEADRAAGYSQITAPGFYIDLESMTLYMKAGVGIDFIVTENNELCWKISAV